MTDQIIEQRIRNRLLEWLEDAAASLEGETDLNELINQWDDWVNDEPIADRYGAPAFTPEELHALALLQSNIESFSRSTKQVLGNESWSKWDSVQKSAQSALSCLSVRGFLPEENEL